MKIEHEKYLKKFLDFPKKYFFKHLFKIRHNIISNYFNDGKFNFKKLIHINYIIIKMGDYKKWGTSVNDVQFEKILHQSFEKFDQIMYMEEDIPTKQSIGIIENYSANKYTSKYSKTINDEFKVNLGIIEDGKNTIEDIDKNNYSEIINQRSTNNPAGLYDIHGIFCKNYLIVISLIYAFRYIKTVANMHDHPGDTQDLIMLYGLLCNLNKKEYISLTRSELKQTYDAFMLEYNLNGNFLKFEKNYCSNKYVPVLIFDGEKYLTSFETLYMYILYIYTRNEKCIKQQKLTGKNALSNERQKSGALFEIDIRKRLIEKGFMTYPDKNNKLKIKYEYDCIAINEKEKTIMLIEAKFEDMSAASIITKNFIKDLILEKRSGLMDIAYRHNERKKYFIKNFKSFPFKLQHKFSEYTIQGFVITKFTPIINRCFNVNIISHKTFFKHFS